MDRRFMLFVYQHTQVSRHRTTIVWHHSRSPVFPVFPISTQSVTLCVSSVFQHIPPILRQIY
ncbi:hypothetical protein N7517_006749 [Penicillium concentricum]|uniref:Uncharacterized protein n=1 Tax=Penicillium concentricum TaxID=293559 RepID=A0A9W9SEM8_9EURO|nr:uncharacterized protein N7517_006749 [Penicillium concentricum]KAJ5374743.1 hypothetical protein N7517_006749 [Penicillium concentricum]